MSHDFEGWRGGLVVGRRTCDLRVDSRVRGPAATLLRNNLRQVVHTLLRHCLCHGVTKQYNLVPAKAGK